MPASITKGKTFTSTETLQPADFHELIDDATISGIDRTNFSATARPVHIGTTAPSSPITGDLWWDSTNTLFKVYENSAWSTILTTADTKYYVGSFTRDLSLNNPYPDETDQVISGLSFKPKAVSLSAIVAGTKQVSWGFHGIIGIYGVNQCWSMYRFYTGIYTTQLVFNRLINLSQSAYIGAYAKLKSFDTDGFTISWMGESYIGNPTGTATVYYIAYR